MDRDEILNATPERLNELVAEARGTPFRKPTHGTCCTCQRCGYHHDDCQCYYAEDIEEAWRLVEEMTKDDKADCEIETWGESYPLGKWSACFYNSHVHAACNGDTVPMAICRAYLLAKMDEY